MEKPNSREEALANERIGRARKNVAKALSLLESTSREVEWACESMKWNDEVVTLLREAAERLGYALAAFVRWDDDPEEDRE